MAFVGAAVVKSLGKYMVRITGIHLAGGQSGTIGLYGDAGADVQLPASFPNDVDGAAKALGLTMTDLCECRLHDLAGGGANPHYHQAQSEPPFRITLTNDVGNDTPDLDIYIHYLHSLIR